MVSSLHNTSYPQLNYSDKDEDNTLLKIRGWLAPPDPSTNYQSALKQRQADTGLWLLNSEAYSKWNSNGASNLWLHGIPGCGKSILSSTVIENIFQVCEDDPGKMLAYFYFDFKDERKQNPDLMIRSLVCQLSQKCIKTPSSLEVLYASYENKQQQPRREDLLKVLCELISMYPETYIILDALDECGNREELMDAVHQIIDWRLHNLHFAVTSRKERDILEGLKDLLEEKDIICLQSHLVDADIRKYVGQRLLRDKSLKKWHKDPDICSEIESTLMEGSKGMQVLSYSC